jgi:hypothetical protein
MGILAAVLLTTTMLLATWSGWRLGLRSMCAAGHWKQEVRREGERMKGKTGWLGFQPLSPLCGPGSRAWQFSGKLLGNQRGSIEVLGVGLAIGLAALLVLQALLWRQRHAQVQTHLRQTLCLKASIGETRELISYLGRINAAIRAGEVTTWSLVLLGGIGLVIKPNWEKVKKGLQLAQELKWAASMVEFNKLRQSGCQLPISVWLTPYEWQGVLQRQADGQARTRARAVWSWQTPLMNYLVRWELGGSTAQRANWQVN